MEENKGQGCHCSVEAAKKERTFPSAFVCSRHVIHFVRHRAKYYRRLVPTRYPASDRTSCFRGIRGGSVCSKASLELFTPFLPVSTGVPFPSLGISAFLYFSLSTPFWRLPRFSRRRHCNHAAREHVQPREHARYAYLGAQQTASPVRCSCAPMHLCI